MTLGSIGRRAVHSFSLLSVSQQITSSLSRPQRGISNRTAAAQWANSSVPPGRTNHRVKQATISTCAEYRNWSNGVTSANR